MFKPGSVGILESLKSLAETDFRDLSESIAYVSATKPPLNLDRDLSDVALVRFDPAKV